MSEKTYSVAMISLGCPKNEVDAEVLLASLKKEGMTLTADPMLADAVVVNTCGFIESAKQESIDQILECCEMKNEGGRLRCVAVTGCLAERYQKEMAEELPEVDVCLGLGSYDKLAVSIRRSLEENEKVYSFGCKTDLALEGDRILSTFGFAYLKIAEGCDNRCSYCAIPDIRGPFRSRNIESLVAEAKVLADQGIRELVLVAQDVTRFGEDWNGGVSALPELLDALQQVEGIFWIRLLYCYPERITDRLIAAMKRNSKVVHYIDLPIQHAADRILKRMNRRSDEKSLREVVGKLRQEMPDVVLRTTLIAGFPGESREEFERLLHFVEEMRFERLGCFAYSAEEGTPAAKMPDQIDEQEKVRRAELVMEKQTEIMMDRNEQLIGNEYLVMSEGYDRAAECHSGRSYMDAPDIDGKIFFTAEKKIPAGTFVRVKIVDVLDVDLIGEMVEVAV